jgi:lipid-A-disaccharide synthase
VGTILPFEPDFFRQAGLEVVPLGHPLMEDYASYPFEELLRKREANFSEPNRPLTLGLLPGSRQQEVHRLLPIFKVAALTLRSLLAPRPVAVVVSAAPETQAKEFLSFIRLGFEISEEPLVQLFSRLDLALVCSGTASLEAALAGVPHEIAYQVSKGTFFFARRLVKVQRIGLANLILGKDVVGEHLQEDVTPLPLARALGKWASVAADRQAFYNDARQLRQKCGSPGVWQRAASAILEFLAERSQGG